MDFSITHANWLWCDGSGSGCTQDEVQAAAKKDRNIPPQKVSMKEAKNRKGGGK